MTGQSFAENFLVGVLSAAIATLSLTAVGGFGLPETAVVAILAGGAATTCMGLGQS